MATPTDLLTRIVAKELEKLEKLTAMETLLCGDQLEALEALARVVKVLGNAPPPTVVEKAPEAGPASAEAVAAALKLVDGDDSTKSLPAEEVKPVVLEG